MERPFSYKLNIFLFLLPALILFIGVLIAPIIMSAYYSFHNWNGLTTPVYIGVKNYVELFSSKSINIMRALKNGMLLAVFSAILLYKRCLAGIRPYRVLVCFHVR